VSALALPFQTSLAPRPDKPFDEEQKKNKDRDKRSDRQTGECDRKRHEKHSLNVEDQKDYGIEIILRVELNLRVANRFDAAFVGGRLVRTGLWRLEKSPPALAVGKIAATARPAPMEPVETSAPRQ